MENPNSWSAFQNQYSNSWAQQEQCINSSNNSYIVRPLHPPPPPLPPPVSCGPLRYNAPWPPPPLSHLQQFPPPPLPHSKEAQQFWQLPTNDLGYAHGNELTAVHQHSYVPQYYSETSTFKNTFNRNVVGNETFSVNNSSLVTFEDEETEEKTQRQKNQEILNKFQEKHNIKYHPYKTPTSRENISTFQEKLKECLHLMNELKDVQSSLCSSLNVEESAWNTLARQANDVKKRLQLSLTELRVVDVGNIELYLRKRRNKRERLKRQKIMKNEERHEMEQCNKRLHEKIDAWQEAIRQSHLAAEMEKKLKKEADSILSVVRRKCAEAKKMLDLVKSVSKLRALKKQAAANKGLFTTSECDESLASDILQLEKVLTARLAEYAEEERTLQVMLDEEHQVTRESAIKIRQQEQKEKLEMTQQQKLFWLFGSEATLNDMDPQYLFREYYTRPERNLDALIHVRQSWDTWLVPQATPESSGIPLTWVMPVKPSSSAWSSYLGEHLPQF